MSNPALSILLSWLLAVGATLNLRVTAPKCDELSVQGAIAPPQAAKKEVEILVRGPIQREALFTLSLTDTHFLVRFPDLEKGTYHVTVTLHLGDQAVAAASASEVVRRCL